MINIAICDDDVALTGKLEMELIDIAKKNFIQVEIEVFWDGKQLTEGFENNTCFDIIFLDIEMKQENGITAAQKIRELDKNVLIIYVTSHECYMKESFAVRPFRFLVKPVNKKEMEECFLNACEDINSFDSYFRYKYQRINYKIPIGEILYFESKKRKVQVVTEKETFELYAKLNEIEKCLKISKFAFLRVHQSFLVNYRHVERLAYDFVILDNKKRISISEERRKKISKEYCVMEDTICVDK